MTQRTAIVTGASGFIGRAVCLALLADERSDWLVYGVQREGADKSLLPAGVVPFDGNANVVADAIFHCAGNTRHDGKGKNNQWRDNVSLTAAMVRYAAVYQPQARLIFTSTGASYLFHHEGRTDNHYAFSKAIAEYVATAHPNCVTLQPCVVLGPGDTKNYAKLFHKAKAGKLNHAIQGSIEFGYVRDIADAHLNAFYRGRAGDHYLLGGVHATWREFFQTINTVVGNEKKVKVLPRWLARLAVKAHEGLCWMTDEPCEITSDLLGLLMRDSMVPLKESLKAKAELGYTASRTLQEMCWLTWQWNKHDAQHLPKTSVADPEASGEAGGKV